MSNNYNKYYKKTKIDVTKEHRDINEAKTVDKIIFAVLITIIAIIPLLTRTKVIDFTSPLITNSSIGSSVVGDVFTYYKYIFLVITTLVLLILFLYRTYGIGIPIGRSYINIPIFILALFVTLSVLFAPYKSLALTGMYNRHEGAITYLCYFTLLFIAANLTYTKKMLNYVIYALYPITLVNAILGLIGFYGIELINYKFARAILFPSSITEDAINEGSRFITTINHGNYVSGIAVVLMVIFMMMFILDKNKSRLAANGILAVLSFAMMLSALARSGFLTFVIILPILVILLFRSSEKVKSFTKLAVQLVIFAIIFVVMANYNPKVWDESMGMFISENPFMKQEQAISNSNIGSATLSQNSMDNNNNNVIINKETAIQYKNFIANELNKVSFVSQAYAAPAENEGSANTATEQFQLPQLPESRVGAGSGRLFIWENTFDLIKQRPLVGYGLDTFVYHFPQNDPDKIANLETHTVIVDKPHNLYINILYGTGSVALIALLALLASHLLKGIKVIISEKLDNAYSNVFMSLFIGWLAYLVQAVFNDSVIGSAPIFWVIFGVSVVITNNLKHNGNNQLSK